MNLDAHFLDFLENVGYNLPAILTLLVAAILTLANWGRHPPAARWFFLGFIWLFVVGLASLAWKTIGVAVAFPDDPLNFTEIVSYVALSACESFGYICFIVAFSIMRRPHRPTPYHDDFPEDDPRPR